jgi:hypothetical protein
LRSREERGGRGEREGEDLTRHFELCGLRRPKGPAEEDESFPCVREEEGGVGDGRGGEGRMDVPWEGRRRGGGGGGGRGRAHGQETNVKIKTMNFFK